MAEGVKIAQILGFEGAALRESFGDTAEKFRLLNDGLRLQLTLAQPRKLILGVGCEEGSPGPWSLRQPEGRSGVGGRPGRHAPES